MGNYYWHVNGKTAKKKNKEKSRAASYFEGSARAAYVQHLISNLNNLLFFSLGMEGTHKCYH